MKMYYVAEVLDWFENISLCWNDVTISSLEASTRLKSHASNDEIVTSLEACDFKRVDA